ncbi:hypothetical protein CFREN_01235 [Corynebacterium freneyi]|nr:hypothetical protein HMPREF3121_05880 [Corynebacterium sp. HMSC11E11]WJZ04238.1 hypothetical protein CFREN_01235 [Corynebacterium freneyi]
MSAMPRVVFVDTSVLTCLLDVPGKNQDRESVIPQFKTYKKAMVTMILPVTAVVETGNHIAQLSDGHQRREAAQRFDKTLAKVESGESPWIPNELTWDPTMIRRLRNTTASGDDLVERLAQKVGAGDCMILAERAEYSERSQIPLSNIAVWTLDAELSARA